MSPNQRKLARHALGLPNARGISYRNRYVAVRRSAYSPGVYDEWSKMVEAGLAERASAMLGSQGRWWLTPEGAQMALDPGERLCPEDFPHEGETP